MSRTGGGRSWLFGGRDKAARGSERPAAPTAPSEDPGTPEPGSGPPLLTEEYGSLVLLRAAHDTAISETAVHELADLLGAEPGVTTVVTGAVGQDNAPAEEFWQRLSEVFDTLTEAGTRTVRLVMSGAGLERPERPSVARRVADAWKLEVIAPDGEVQIVPGGSLFVRPEPPRVRGWWGFSPGARPVALGSRQPSPAWQHGVEQVPERTAGGCVVHQIPAGLLARSPYATEPQRGDLCYSVPVDPRGPTVLVGVPEGGDLSAADVGEVLSALPAALHSRVRLAPGSPRDILRTGQSAAELLGNDVVVYTGMPLLTPSAPMERASARAVLVGADGTPRWRPFVDAVVCAPAREGEPAPAPRLLRWTVPVPGRGDPEPGVVRLSERWRATVTRAGLWITGEEERNTGPTPPPPTTREVDAEGPAIEVGRPGEALDASLWPELSRLLSGLGSDLGRRARLYVHGTATDGGRALRALAAQHGVRTVRFAPRPAPAAGHGGAPATRPGEAPGAPNTAGATPGSPPNTGPRTANGAAPAPGSRPVGSGGPSNPGAQVQGARLPGAAASTANPAGSVPGSRPVGFGGPSNPGAPVPGSPLPGAASPPNPGGFAPGSRPVGAGPTPNPAGSVPGSRPAGAAPMSSTVGASPAPRPAGVPPTSGPAAVVPPAHPGGAVPRTPGPRPATSAAPAIPGTPPPASSEPSTSNAPGTPGQSGVTAASAPSHPTAGPTAGPTASVVPATHGGETGRPQGPGVPVASEQPTPTPTAAPAPTPQAESAEPVADPVRYPAPDAPAPVPPPAPVRPPMMSMSSGPVPVAPQTRRVEPPGEPGRDAGPGTPPAEVPGAGQDGLSAPARNPAGDGTSESGQDTGARSEPVPAGDRAAEDRQEQPPSPTRVTTPEARPGTPVAPAPGKAPGEAPNAAPEPAATPDTTDVTPSPQAPAAPQAPAPERPVAPARLAALLDRLRDDDEPVRAEPSRDASAPHGVAGPDRPVTPPVAEDPAPPRAMPTASAAPTPTPATSTVPLTSGTPTRPPAPAAPAAPAAPSVLSAPAVPAIPLPPLFPAPFRPGHVSTQAERQAFRVLAEAAWDRHGTAVSRTLTRLPALRGQEQEAARADLIALHLYLYAPEGPFSPEALARGLYEGEERLLPYAACVTSGLRRMPSYRGVAFRGADGPDGGLLRPGVLLRDPAPVCVLPLGAGVPRPGGAQYAVWSVTGRRVRQLADRPGAGKDRDEVVLPPGTLLRVLDVRQEGGAPLTLLREVPLNGPGIPARHGGAELDADDRTALARLDEALRGHPVAPGRADWPRLCAGSLERAAGRPPFD
ncbi:hypothetical protein ACIRA2_28890 [Streptomyces griseoviridis]